MVQEEIPQVRALGPAEFARQIRHAHLHPTTKLVALHVMTYADFEGGDEVFPGEQLLADELGRTTRCVREHLKILRDKGILTRVKRTNRRRAVYDVYQLSWPLDPERVPMRLDPDERLDGDLPPVRLPRNRTKERKRVYID